MDFSRGRFRCDVEIDWKDEEHFGSDFVDCKCLLLFESEWPAAFGTQYGLVLQETGWESEYKRLGICELEWNIFALALRSPVQVMQVKGSMQARIVLGVMRRSISSEA